MIDTELLGTCTIDDAIGLYRNMILEYRGADSRLMEAPTDDKSLRTLVAFGLNREDSLFYVLRYRGLPVGFIDSARVSGNGAGWFIKALWIEKRLRVPEVFLEAVGKLERALRKRGAAYVFNTALLDDPVANGLWIDAGYEFEEGRRVKRFPPA